MKFAILRPLLAASLAWCLCGAGAEDPVVAQRGKITLTASQLKDAFAAQSAETRAKIAADPATLANFVQSALLSRVLLNQAEAAKWDRTPAVAAALLRAHNTLVVNLYLADQAKPPANYPSEADIKSAYTLNQSKLMQPRRYHLQQIMIGFPTGADQTTVAAALAKAQALHDQATKPQADFQSLAANSTDKLDVQAKGDMGWVAEDQLLPVIKTAVAGLPVGGISQPVRTDAGWHVLKLVDTTPAGPATLAQVHDQLAQLLRQQQAQQLERDYLAKMLKAQAIQVNAIAIGNALGGGSGK